MPPSGYKLFVLFLFDIVCIKAIFCVDIDECLDHCKADNVTCINLNGSYECVCPKGALFNISSLQCQGDYSF